MKQLHSINISVKTVAYVCLNECDVTKVHSQAVVNPVGRDDTRTFVSQIYTRSEETKSNYDSYTHCVGWCKYCLPYVVTCRCVVDRLRFVGSSRRFCVLI